MDLYVSILPNGDISTTLNVPPQPFVQDSLSAALKLRSQSRCLLPGGGGPEKLEQGLLNVYMLL